MMRVSSALTPFAVRGTTWMIVGGADSPAAREAARRQRPAAAARRFMLTLYSTRRQKTSILCLC